MASIRTQSSGQIHLDTITPAYLPRLKNHATFITMSHKIIISVPLIILCCSLGAQTTNSQIEKYLLLKQKSISPDQLFVHLDRNKYKPGDTIYFQAYIRDRFTNEFESQSISLYALLFDDNRVIVDSSRFKIDNSTCAGWMSIPLKSNSGKYHFVAFTSIMQNFDPSEAFQTDLLVRGADKIGGENTSIDSGYFDLKFLPEGGNSVQGLEQKIGFNATDSKGYPVYIEGLVKYSSGSTLDTIKSGAYGPGFFVCNPEPGMYVEITKGANKEKIWKLPNPVTSGICMSVKSINNRSFSIDIQSDNDKNDTFKVVGIMNANQIFFQNLVLNKKQRVVIETDQLPSGIAQITVFSKDLHPIAERLYYVNSDKHLIFNIDSGSTPDTTGQETELTISVNDGTGNPAKGFFSISVTDSISGCAAGIYTPGIESVLNYYPYFQRNLPRKVIETGLENLTNEEIDLILMIYGWSRYNWNFTDKQTAAQDLINYDLINIKVQDASKVHPSVKQLDLISLEGSTVMHLTTNKMGETDLRLDSLPENTKSVILLPGKNVKNNITGVIFRIPYNGQFIKDMSRFTSQQSVITGIYADIFSVNKPMISDKSIVSDLYKQGITDKTFEIPEVTISAAKKIEYTNKYEEFYKNANVKSLSHEQLSSYNSVAEAIRKIVNPYRMEVADAFHPKAAIYLRPSHSFFGGNIKAMFVLDGMPLNDDYAWQRINSLDPAQLASISVLNGPQGHIIYGEEASGGVIFINTYYPGLSKIHTDWKNQNKRNNLLTPINIFRQNVEFYNPSRSEVEDNLVLRDRTTVYWNPEVYFNGKDAVRIKYLNLKHPGPVLISINGASVNNLIGTGRASYRVR